MPQPSELPWKRSLSIAATLGLLRGWMLFVALTLEHWIPLDFNTASATTNGHLVPEPPKPTRHPTRSTWFYRVTVDEDHRASLIEPER